MTDNIDLRCDPSDVAGLLDEITRRDRIIRALMTRLQRNPGGQYSDLDMLQATSEEDVGGRTRESERAFDALSEAKAEAEAARHRLSDAISAISEAFALFDPADQLILCNDAFRELWGFGPSVTGRTFADLLTDITERYKPADPNWAARCVQDHQSGTGTSQYRLGGGKIIQIRERKTSDGFTVGLYADITELAEVQASDAARQQLLNIVNFLPDATFAVDEKQKVIAWNRAVEEMTGITKESIIGQGDYAHGIAFYGERRPTLLDFLDSDKPELMSKYENVRRKGNTLYGEDFVQSAFGGRGAYLDRMASPLLDREGNQIGAIESLRDITNLKRAEADLRSLQEQLRQAAKMEAIGRLAGGIAHDFNNQLTIVQGYCELLLSRSRCETLDCKREIQEVLRAAERSAQLTGQLLAFGHRRELHSEVLNLEEVLTSLRDPLGRMIGEDIPIEVQVAPALWNVKTDRNQLEQAIINLAINARDAMPAGGQLTIEARNTVLDAEYVLHHMGASEGEHVCISVKDTGVGMDEHTKARIFEPFFTTKPVGVGTGLGLAIVYGFVTRSEGYVEVISEAGHGSCFNLYFPRTTEAYVCRELVSPVQTSTGSETILLIEDQEALRALTAQILENSGYHVLQAQDGHSAIELNRRYSSTLDLVLCDVVMPGISGPDVVQKLKMERQGVKIIYVTGYAEEPTLRQAELGAHVLSKPFTPETLLRVVRQVLDEDIGMLVGKL